MTRTIQGFARQIIKQWDTEKGNFLRLVLALGTDDGGVELIEPNHPAKCVTIMNALRGNRLFGFVGIAQGKDSVECHTKLITDNCPLFYGFHQDCLEQIAIETERYILEEMKRSNGRSIDRSKLSVKVPAHVSKRWGPSNSRFVRRGPLESVLEIRLERAA